MRGTFLFDQLNDVVYFKTDEALQQHLLNICLREGLIQQDSKQAAKCTTLDLNAIVQLFSPLVTSQRIMLDQFNNPYTAIHTQDGTIMTFAKRLGFLFIAVGTEKTESLSVIQRRLHIFLRLVNLLCGSAFNLLKATYPGAIERQRLLGALIDKWEELRKEELAYQIEAVEKLVINEYLTQKCVTILENVLQKMRRSTKSCVNHAALLVNTKLLTVYSSRNTSELTAADVMTLTMLAHTHHPTCRFELPHSPRHSPVPSSPIATHFRPISSPLNNRLQVPRLSLSPPENPVLDGQVQSSSEGNALLSVPLCSESEESSDSEFYSPCGSPTLHFDKTLPKVEEGDDTSNSKLEDESNTAGDILNEEVNMFDFSEMEDKLNKIKQSIEYTNDILFLQNSISPLSPYQVYTIKIMEGVVLIVVCDVGKSLISAACIQAINILHESQVNKQSNLAKQQFDCLEVSIKRLIEATKKITEDNRLTRNIINRWDVVRKNGFLEFLKSTTARFMTSKLESSVSALLETIQEIFQTFCLPDDSAYIPLTSEIINILADIQAHVRFNLADYGDYLRIKSLRNVTLTSLQFPDLVHFIYVNRTTNQLTVPSMDEVARVNNTNLAKKLKEKIIRMVEFTRAQLQCGHFAITWRDNQFQYSYFLWFEDLKGNPLKPQIPFQGLKNFPPPGCLCGDFFKLLRAECFPNEPENTECYELMCMHSAKSAPRNSVEEIRKLMAAIWELTSVSSCENDAI